MEKDDRQASPRYVPAIDGLRAIAVLSVLIFHLGINLIPGGFVGVDIFFVISGFVVTASVMHARGQGFAEFLTHFYTRRIIRIMPALVVCLTITTLIYTVLIPRSWLSSLTSQTGLSAYVGASNIILSLNRDDYFAPVAEFNPFLHTWSLGVEEQFYLIFPMIMFLNNTGRMGADNKICLCLVAMLGLVSLIFSSYFTLRWQQWAFYMLPARFWELAAGMGMALTQSRWQNWMADRPRWISILIAAVGVLLLAGSLAIPESKHFPFPLALLPVAAAMLILAHVCGRPAEPLAAALGAAPMLAIGQRSYSIYLWHWPILVMMRWTVGLYGMALPLVGAILSLTAGYLSYRYVEQPLRHSRMLKNLSYRNVVLVGIVVIAITGTSSWAVLTSQPVLSLSRTANAEWYTSEDTKLRPNPAGCQIVAQQRAINDGRRWVWRRTGCSPIAGRIFAIGNSHAASYAPMLRQFTLDTGIETQLYFRSGCSYLPLYRTMRSMRSCKPFLEIAEKEIRGVLQAGDVLFMPSLRLRQTMDQWGRFPEDKFPDVDLAAVSEAEDVLRPYSARGAKLVFEAPKPMLPAPVYRCVDWYTRSNPICGASLVVSRMDSERRRTPMLAAMRAIAARNPDVAIWDPLPVLCPGATCLPFDGTSPIFFDMHHITLHANEMLRSDFRRGMASYRKVDK